MSLAMSDHLGWQDKYGDVSESFRKLMDHRASPYSQENFGEFGI